MKAVLHLQNRLHVSKVYERQSLWGEICLLQSSKFPKWDVIINFTGRGGHSRTVYTSSDIRFDSVCAHKNMPHGMYVK